MDAMNHLGTQQIQDQHLEIILEMMKRLPLKENQQQYIYHSLAIYINKSEYQIQKIIEILSLIDAKIIENNFQQSILIVSNLLRLTETEIHVPSILQLLMRYTNDQILKIALPNLTSNLVKLLILHYKSKIAKFGTALLVKIIEYCLRQDLGPRITFDPVKGKTLARNIIIDKINEYINELCRQVTHLPTPQLSKAYKEAIISILSLKDINTLLDDNTILSLVQLYLYYYDGKGIDELILIISNMKSAELQLKIEEEFMRSLKLFAKLSNEIESHVIVSQFRKIKFLFRFIENNKNIQRCIQKALKKGIYYKFNNIQRVNNLISYNYALQAQQNDEYLDIEMIPILNNDQWVRKELILMIQEISIPQHYYLDKIHIMMQQLYQKIYIDQVDNVIKIQIQDLLKLSGLIFIQIYSQKQQLLKHSIQILLRISYSLILDSQEAYVELFQIRIIQLLGQVYQEFDEFLKLSYIDYMICQSASSISGIKYASLNQLQKIGDINKIIDEYGQSILFRNFNKLQESNEKGQALQTILYIFSEYQNTYSNGTIQQALEIFFKTFDKYYIRSDPQFTQQYLRFINQFLLNWKNPQLDNNLITILRNIIHQIAQFFTHKQHQLQAFQVYYNMIPFLSEKPLKDSKPDQIFGMNDGLNVQISNVLAVIFQERRQAFEFVLEEDNQQAQLWVWKIILRMYEYNPNIVFFQRKSIQGLFDKYGHIDQDLNQTLKKKYQNMLEFAQKYSIQEPQFESYLKDFTNKIRPN
ncbi:hypothetical protein pb186bvf_020870 [Paramecium bursaria]